MSEEEGYFMIGGLMNIFSYLTKMTIRGILVVGLFGSMAVALNSLGQCGAAAIRERREVMDLIYWRDPKKSGAVLAVIIVALLLFANLPLITLLSYVSLAVLMGTFGFRLYKAAQSTIKHDDSTNPFQHYLECDCDIPQETVHKQADLFVNRAKNLFVQLRRLFLVENMCDSIKFALLLWALTYVGAMFSGVALTILAVLGIFTIPKFYEVYKNPIDAKLAVAQEHMDKLQKILHEKIPCLKSCNAPTVELESAKKTE